MEKITIEKLCINIFRGLNNKSMVYIERIPDICTRTIVVNNEDIDTITNYFMLYSNLLKENDYPSKIVIEDLWFKLRILDTK